jgi:hypothetical protein
MIVHSYNMAGKELTKDLLIRLGKVEAAFESMGEAMTDRVKEVVGNWN